MAICALFYLVSVMVLHAFSKIAEGELIRLILGCLLLLLYAGMTIFICLTTGMLRLKYVPRWLRTKWVCQAVVESNSYRFGLDEVINGRALQYVPESLHTADFCLAAVKRNGWALYYVPESLRTADLCLAAVRQDGEALQYVPESLRTEVLAKIEAQTPGGEVV